MGSIAPMWFWGFFEAFIGVKMFVTDVYMNPVWVFLSVVFGILSITMADGVKTAS